MNGRKREGNKEREEGGKEEYYRLLISYLFISSITSWLSHCCLFFPCHPSPLVFYVYLYYLSYNTLTIVFHSSTPPFVYFFFPVVSIPPSTPFNIFCSLLPYLPTYNFPCPLFPISFTPPSTVRLPFSQVF